MTIRRTATALCAALALALGVSAAADAQSAQGGGPEQRRLRADDRLGRDRRAVRAQGGLVCGERPAERQRRARRLARLHRLPHHRRGGSGRVRNRQPEHGRAHERSARDERELHALHDLRLRLAVRGDHRAARCTSTRTRAPSSHELRGEIAAVASRTWPRRTWTPGSTSSRRSSSRTSTAGLPPAASTATGTSTSTRAKARSSSARVEAAPGRGGLAQVDGGTRSAPPDVAASSPSSSACQARATAFRAATPAARSAIVGGRYSTSSRPGMSTSHSTPLPGTHGFSPVATSSTSAHAQPTSRAAHQRPMTSTVATVDTSHSQISERVGPGGLGPRPPTSTARGQRPATSTAVPPRRLMRPGLPRPRSLSPVRAPRQQLLRRGGLPVGGAPLPPCLPRPSATRRAELGVDAGPVGDHAVLHLVGRVLARVADDVRRPGSRGRRRP